MNREDVFQALSEIDDRLIAEAVRYAPEHAAGSSERIVQMKRKRVFTIVLAAALILALGVAAYAISGISRSTGTHPMPQTAEYTDLSALPKIEKIVGYPVIVPEQFSNGYTFAGLRVDGQAVFGENNEVLKEFYGVNVTYSRDNAPELTLHLSPVLELEGGGESPEPGERRTGDVRVELSLDHYKVVPENYEKTEDDLAREAAGHYYISFGSDEIKELDIAFAGFTLDGVNYTLMDMAAEAGCFETLSLVAGEIIQAAGS